MRLTLVVKGVLNCHAPTEKEIDDVKGRFYEDFFLTLFISNQNYSVL
jgi:hypothetical protein